MIHSLKITDPKRTAFSYIDSIIYFENNKEFTFKPGVNLIVGPNGSGKSTLIDMMRFYFGELTDRVPTAKPFFQFSYFDNAAGIGKSPLFYDGVDIVAAFNTPVFSLHTNLEKQKVDMSIESIVSKIDTRHKSVGEKNKQLFNDFFSVCFSQLNHPSAETRYPKYVNPKKVLTLSNFDDKDTLWGNALRAQQSWYRKNNVKDDIPTFLLDEPEANMDIASCIEFGNMFAEMANGADVQYIMVVHDPYIIRKVAETGKANIIELYPNYLKIIDEYFKK